MGRSSRPARRARAGHGGADRTKRARRQDRDGEGPRAFGAEHRGVFEWREGFNGPYPRAGGLSGAGRRPEPGIHELGGLVFMDSGFLAALGPGKTTGSSGDTRMTRRPRTGAPLGELVGKALAPA